MMRNLLVGALLLTLGAGAALVLSPADRKPAPFDTSRPPAAPSRAVAERPGFKSVPRRDDPDLERRIAALERKLAQASEEREQLLARIDALAAEVDARTDDTAGNAKSAPPAPAAPVVVAEAPAAPTANATVDYEKSAKERALIAAGIDPAAAGEIKRRDDELTMAEIYLRDQAAREQWLDTPRFKEEMDALQAERTSIREEIGDDAYDHYLYALGQTNRVRVDDVIAESPAAQAGLRPGDMILRYGDARLFAPGDLVRETHGGQPGETVRLDVIRNGERIELQVPRGPLGLRAAPTQYQPESG